MTIAVYPAQGRRQPNHGLIALLPSFRRALLLTSASAQAERTAKTVERFAWASGVRQVDDLTAAAVEDHLADLANQGRRPKTLKNIRSAISRFCTWLRVRGLIDRYPCRDVVLPRTPKRPPVFLTDAELTRLLDAADDRGIWPEVAAAVATGLRLSELRRLRWSEVDLDRRRLLVLRAKGEKYRPVDLNALALEAFRRQAVKTGGLVHVFPARPGRRRKDYEDRPASAGSWCRLLRPLQAVVPKLTTLPGKSTGRLWHCLRHTFASRLAQNGVSLYKLARWLGHSDVRTTQIYAHLSDDYDSDIERF